MLHGSQQKQNLENLRVEDRSGYIQDKYWEHTRQVRTIVWEIQDKPLE